MIERLLEPCKIGTMSLRNRLVYPAMTFKLGDHKSRLTDAEVDSMIYRAKQNPGPGLIIFPGLNDSLYPRTMTAVNINTDDAMFSLRNQVSRVHKYGVCVAAEIGVVGFCPDDISYGASEMAYPIALRAMSKEDIELYYKKITKLAQRAKTAGFDAVILQISVNKKILGTFVSPYTNHRTDEYGGSLENRARILVEAVRRVREVVGQDFTIMLDMKVDELLGTKGLQLEDGLRVAELVAPYVDVIKPIVGGEYSVNSPYSPYFTPAGPTLDVVKAVKEHLPSIHVLAGNKLGQPSLAERAVAEYGADLVALGRPLFADPAWIEKAADGRENEILHCIGCMNCYTEASRKEIYPMQRACTVNPCNLREDKFYHLESTAEPKRILVIGGGLAGMEAAATLAERGHKVVLCEKEDQLGGQFIPASQEKEKPSYRTLIPYKKKMLERSGAEIRMNTLVDEAYLKQEQPDIVVLATGAVPKALPKNLFGEIPVYQGNDILMGNRVEGKRVVVIGGGYIGLSVALQLAEEGKSVSIVDTAGIGTKVIPRLLNYYNDKLVSYGVPFYENCPVLGSNENGLEIMHFNFRVTVPADAIVQAVGTKPVNDLQSVIEALGIPCVSIGDCKRIGDALYAIRDGAEVGRIL
ncbi:MAG: FAD-dependent oxidoreductase [Peptococcaceae bacterium]|nr:FAD-dependent oxidoreductase [Peptococcaceae bacterium]